MAKSIENLKKDLAKAKASLAAVNTTPVINMVHYEVANSWRRRVAYLETLIRELEKI